jgi:hypothetical protein
MLQEDTTSERTGRLMNDTLAYQTNVKRLESKRETSQEYFLLQSEADPYTDLIDAPEAEHNNRHWTTESLRLRLSETASKSCLTES